MSRYAAPAGYYTVRDVATLRGTDHAAAWRWLSRNAGRHFLRMGGRRVISKERYRRLAMEDYVEDKLAKVAAQVHAIDERLTEEVMRLDARISQVASARAR